MVEVDEGKSLLEEIAKNRAAIGTLDEGDHGLGYRGLVVEAQVDNVARPHELPHSFCIGHTAHGNGLDIAGRIIRSMQTARVLDESLHSHLTQELKAVTAREKPKEEASQADQTTAAPSAAPEPGGPTGTVCRIELGHFNPGFWNDGAHIGVNNCYNYASNRRTNTFAQPGRATGHQATVMACDKVTAGALSDGLHKRFNCFPDSEKPRWLMALVVAPGYDYHWYRKQLEGFWGHKPGGTAARNYDNNGHVIMNPETAARGPYTNFCGYFYACKSQKIS